MLHRNWKQTGALMLLCLAMICLAATAAAGSTVLKPKARGPEVQRMQQALISLGYLRGSADGIYGTNTENAVRKFQKKNHLKVDGIAGPATLTLLYQKAAVATPAPVPAKTAEPTRAPTATPAPTPVSTAPAASAWFGGNYKVIRRGMTGQRVVLLQTALKRLKYYTGRLDGKFGANTETAVRKFQKARKLTQDGIAGKRTLQALEKILARTQKPAVTPTSIPTPTPTPTPMPAPESGEPVSIPSIGQVRLLHWYNDIKPTLRTKQTILLVDPATGIHWTLQLYSLGRHADAEPLTAEDTARMVRAFGGKNTWNQQAVYVRLPSGVWTVGSTHDMPHMSGSIKDNNFNGHLCVHFLRDMSECKKMDPKYGVANQNTIRTFWKELTGQTVE